MEQVTQARRVVRFGAFELDLTTGELRKNGLKLKLQEQPFQVLAMLLERSGDVVTREELSRKLWPADTFVDFDKGINIAINKLREALSDSAETPRFVQTVARRGYRFIASVEPLATKGAGPSTAPAPARRRLWVYAAALALFVVALVFALYRRLPIPHPGKTPAGKAMLVVLPFENLSGDPGQGFFTEGLTEAMITQLGALEPTRLGVIARTTAMQYKATRKTTNQIGHELGVNYVLEGSVFRAGGRVRITVQLIQCSDQTHLWAHTYERDLTDVLAVQSEVASAVADEIQLKLTFGERARLASTRPVNGEAYDDYLKGRSYWNKRTVEALTKGIEFFERAAQKDPNFALAYSGLADSYGLLGTNPYDALPPQEAMPKAEQAAVRAVEIDNNLAEAHASLAYIRSVYDWNFPEAEREFKRAFELNDGYATAHQWYAWYLTAMGRLDEAMAETNRARRHDPLSAVISNQLEWCLYMARRYDQAIEQGRKTLEFEPKSFMTHYNLGQAYVQKKMYAEAIAEFEKGKTVSGGLPIMLMALGHAYALAGKGQQARKTLAELADLSRLRYVPPLYFAAIYTALGQRDRAFEWLLKAASDRSDYCIQLNTEPMSDGLRSDPRFAGLLRRISPAL